MNMVVLSHLPSGIGHAPKITPSAIIDVSLHARPGPSKRHPVNFRPIIRTAASFRISWSSSSSVLYVEFAGRINGKNIKFNSCF